MYSLMLNENQLYPQCYPGMSIERETLVLWRRPVTTLYYFTLQLISELIRLTTLLLTNTTLILSSVVLSAMVAAAIHFEGPHQAYVRSQIQ